MLLLGGWRLARHGHLGAPIGRGHKQNMALLNFEWVIEAF
jgi:hypothetical protein